jgi:hypothetical protein
MKNEIPKILHSYSTGKPFTNCVDCSKDLLNSNEAYFIEKVIRQYNKNGYTAKDIIFEYAMCTTCAEDIKKEFSAASKKAMNNYFAEINPHSSSDENLNCMVKGKPVEEYQEYQIFSLCQGKYMLTDQPFAIGLEALEELSAVISIETKDELNRRMGKYFGTPPELEELIPNHRVPLLI